MAKTLKKGDEVEWKSSQGKVKGTVKKKLTSPTKIKGHKVAASKENPEYMVESSKTGKKAAHKASALKKTAKKSTSTKKSAAKSNSTKKSTKAKSAKSATAKKPAKQKKDDEQTIKEFKKLVNMQPKQLERWLDTDESKKVGFKDEGKGESVGHDSGGKILKLLAKRKDRYTDDDVKHIHKVVGYIKRHLAQRPRGDIRASNWRYSLMNWGHDPAK